MNRRALMCKQRALHPGGRERGVKFQIPMKLEAHVTCWRNMLDQEMCSTHGMDSPLVKIFKMTPNQLYLGFFRVETLDIGLSGPL